MVGTRPPSPSSSPEVLRLLAAGWDTEPCFGMCSSLDIVFTWAGSTLFLYFRVTSEFSGTIKPTRHRASWTSTTTISRAPWSIKPPSPQSRPIHTTLPAKVVLVQDLYNNSFYTNLRDNATSDRLQMAPIQSLSKITGWFNLSTSLTIEQTRNPQTCLRLTGSVSIHGLDAILSGVLTFTSRTSIQPQRFVLFRNHWSSGFSGTNSNFNQARRRLDFDSRLNEQPSTSKTLHSRRTVSRARATTEHCKLENYPLVSSTSHLNLNVNAPLQIQLRMIKATLLERIQFVSSQLLQAPQWPTSDFKSTPQALTAHKPYASPSNAQSCTHTNGFLDFNFTAASNLPKTTNSFMFSKYSTRTTSSVPDFEAGRVPPSSSPAARASRALLLALSWLRGAQLGSESARRSKRWRRICASREMHTRALPDGRHAARRKQAERARFEAHRGRDPRSPTLRHLRARDAGCPHVPCAGDLARSALGLGGAQSGADSAGTRRGGRPSSAASRARALKWPAGLRRRVGGDFAMPRGSTRTAGRARFDSGANGSGQSWLPSTMGVQSFRARGAWSGCGTARRVRCELREAGVIASPGALRADVFRADLDLGGGNELGMTVTRCGHVQTERAGAHLELPLHFCALMKFPGYSTKRLGTIDDEMERAHHFKFARPAHLLGVKAGGACALRRSIVPLGRALGPGAAGEEEAGGDKKREDGRANDVSSVELAGRERAVKVASEEVTRLRHRATFELRTMVQSRGRRVEVRPPPSVLPPSRSRGIAMAERASREYKPYTDAEPERESLLPSNNEAQAKLTYGPHSCYSKPQFGVNHLLIAFAAGTLACFLAQYAICGSSCFTYYLKDDAPATQVDALAAPWAGSTERHNYPPPTPTNAFPSLFPTDVGYAGKTPTGAEAAVIATAPTYPLHTGAAQLVAPDALTRAKGKKFDLFKKWGNLSPWYSVDRTAFGLDSGPEPPQTCRVTGLHFLHRHGARYPTAYASYGGPANFSSRLNAAASNWTAKGDLEFMNEWTYKLGEEVDLGISMRLKYGFLLKNFTEMNTIPVFRTESQDRMLASAMNFAIGFFGYPFEGQYQQSITIEAVGYNNTLAPYKTCPNANDKLKADRGREYVAKWAGVYLKNALKRVGSQMVGYDLTIEDVYVLQQLCAYETVALGYSKFCELFTEEEWDVFDVFRCTATRVVVEMNILFHLTLMNLREI
ncbi:hypothetical protein DFH06DRAFT_1119467 [Mycena polygramma]|nr:hypothetical protein DFH06DRAFT_1119467 [Mycena polygramma]